MSKLNKIITNKPVVLTDEEVENLSLTLSAVQTAGGGGTGGVEYHNGQYIQVNNTQHTISLNNEAIGLLTRDIPSAVSDLSDASLYATKPYVNGAISSIYYTNILGLVDALNAKQDTLTFGYDENDAISSINSHKLAGAGGVTGDYYSASNPSGFINSAQAETQILAKNYITSGVGELANFYSKTDTSSKTEISAAIKDFLPKPTGLADDQYYAMTTSGWEIIQGAGDVSGITTVAHDDTLTGNGNQQMLGVDITKIQTKLTDAQIQNITDVTTLKTASSTWDNVSAKLNTTDFNTYTATTAPATYQAKGDYATNTLVQDTSAAITALIPSTAGLASETDLQIVSAGVDYVSANAITAHQSLTDYYTKSQTSGATEISNALSNKVNKPNTALNNKYLVLRTDNAGDVSGWVDFNANVYSKTEADGRYQKIADMGSYLTTAQYETDSATFYTTSNPAGYLTKTVADTYYQPTGYYATSAGLTTGNQYAMTTNGWEVVQGGTSFTGVITDTTLTGDGTDSSHKLGVAWSALSSNLINSANTASNAWISGTEFSSFAQIKTAIDSKQPAGDYLPTSGGTVSGQLNISGGSNFDNQFLRFSRDGVQAHSRIGVGSNGALVFKHNNGAGQNLQMEISTEYENNAYKNGSIILKAGGAEKSKVVNVSISGANNMSVFDATNGPNYMLRKTADGFDIGACVINVTQLPAQTEANTYYFIYDT